MPLPRLTLQGNLVADPDLRFSASGKAIAKMRVACSESRKNEAGEWQDGPTAFLDMTAFDLIAEACADQLHKGSAVVVQGRLQQREWLTDDGQKRQAYEVLIEHIGPSLRAKKGGARRQEQDPWASAAHANIADDDAPF
jgi:single-strand DNA-binding protein